MWEYSLFEPGLHGAVTDAEELGGVLGIQRVCVHSAHYTLIMRGVKSLGDN